MKRRRIGGIVAIVVAAAGLAWSRKPGDPFKPGYNLYSHQQDIQLGQIQAAQVRRRYQEVRDQFLQGYIRQIGERLANTPEARQSEFPFSFTLLNVPAVNAFALPGGPMFVFTGLVKSTDNEAQLAGVMAHEMSHVILRHGTHEASKARATGFAASLAAALGAAATGNQAGLAQLTRMGAGLGQNSLILHFSREAESEADLLGTHLMAEAGYNPIEMAHFFGKLAQMGNATAQFFSDHPNPDNRQHAIEEEITGLPVRQYGYETGSFARAKMLINELPTAGPGPAVSGPPLPPQVQPSGAWKQTAAKSFLVSLPSNWQVYGIAASNWLIIAPYGGVSKSSKGAIDLGLGVMLSYFQPENRQMSLGTATLSLVAHLHGQDPTIQMTAAQQRNVIVDGSEGMVSLLQAKSASLGPEVNLLLTVMRPEGIFYALSIAPVRYYGELQSSFNQILHTIHFTSQAAPAPVGTNPQAPR